MTFVLQWVPPVCHSIIFPAPVWAAPTVFQHRIHSSCMGRVTLWAAVPPRWRNGHAGWAGPAPSGTARMKVSIEVTSFRRIYLFIYIRTTDIPFLYSCACTCIYACLFWGFLSLKTEICISLCCSALSTVHGSSLSLVSSTSSLYSAVSDALVFLQNLVID